MQHTIKNKIQSRQQWFNRRISPPSMNRALVVFVIVFGILFFPTSAWSAEISLQVDNNRIQGFAHQAKLEQVLGQLAEQAGYTIFLDKALLDAKVNFDIPTALPAEKAIKRIVHPHSHALVFTRIPGQTDIRIDQVKVFSQGNQGAGYVTVTARNGAMTVQPSYSRGSASIRSANTSRNAVHAGLDGVRANVRPPVEFTTNAMGFTGFKIRPRSKGEPDYRPSSLTMSKAYTRYRNERQNAEQKSQNNLLKTSQQQMIQNQYRYQQYRTQSIQQSATQSTP